MYATPDKYPNPLHTPGEVQFVGTYAEMQRAFPQGCPRTVTHGQRARIYRTYGIAPADHVRYQIDHLVPLAIGGSNGDRNLWPQLLEGPLTNDDKDHAEQVLIIEVHAGRVDLRTAQAMFATDWARVFALYVDRDPAALCFLASELALPDHDPLLNYAPLLSAATPPATMPRP